MGADGQPARRKRRGVPELRKRHGAPESRKELLARLARERAERDEARAAAREASLKNPGEFRFSFYSKNAPKSRDAESDELRRMLRYVDCEIKRCSSRLQCGMAETKASRHIKFADSSSGAAESDSEPDTRPAETAPVPSDRQMYEKYLGELWDKRNEIISRLGK